MTFAITFKGLEATLEFHENNWEIVLQLDTTFSKTKGSIEHGSKSLCIALNHVQVLFEYIVSDTIVFTLVIEDGQDVLSHKGTLSRKPVTETVLPVPS